MLPVRQVDIGSLPVARAAVAANLVTNILQKYLQKISGLQKGVVSPLE